MVTQGEGGDVPADDLRTEPIGEDAKGCLYYFFSSSGWEDCRLYRMDPPAGKKAAKKEGPRWQTVCTTVEEMQAFAEQLSSSRCVLLLRFTRAQALDRCILIAACCSKPCCTSLHSSLWQATCSVVLRANQTGTRATTEQCSVPTNCPVP